MRSYCYLTVTDRGLVVESSYDEQFTADLKAQVAGPHRLWDPNQKTWWLDKRYAARIKALAKERFGSVYLVEGGITTDLHTGETVEP